MKRKLLKREKALIVLVAILLLAACYYLFLYHPTEKRIANAQAEIQVLEPESIGLEAKMSEMNRMQQAADQEKEANGGAILAPNYDNFEYVMNYLNVQMSSVESYNINFQPVEEEGSLIRRVITVSFETSSYANAKQILTNLHNSMYRCKLNTLNMSSSDSLNSGRISASVNLTFYEWLQY